MAETIINNNQVIIAGEIVSDFEYSHHAFGEGFYTMKLRVSRLSHSDDTIPLLVSERLIDVNQSYIGQYIEVEGQFRSYNKHVSRKSHLLLSVFVRELRMLDTIDDYMPNLIFLDGYICKQPVYRKTPLGREITDLLLAVNRAYSKSDYIPCICWGRSARYVNGLRVGSHIRIWGRIQSREYQKRTDENSVVFRTAYEISVSKLEHCNDLVQLQQRVAE